jgi:two-component system sensor histidine kinase/response regulator
MNDHIAKPIDPEMLLAMLSRYLRARAPGDTLEAPGRGVAPAADPPLPSVEGLDTADGLLRVAGNRGLYVKLLRQFVDQQGEAPARIAEALGADDRKTAERLAHTVKGVAGNLGARAVHAAAGALEQALAAGDDGARVAPLQRRLGDEVGALVGRLRPALGEESAPAAPTVPADPAVLKELVAQMRKLLGAFDPAATDILEARRDLFRSLLEGDEFAAFEQDVNGYAFGEAQARLERAAAARGM